MSDSIIAFIRTAVPVGVGAFLAWLLTLGIELDSQAEAGLITAATAVLTAAYYALAKWLAGKWVWAGWLLGYPSQPHYEPQHRA